MDEKNGKRKRDQNTVKKIKIEIEEATAQTSKYFDSQINTESKQLFDLNNNEIKSEETFLNVKQEPGLHFEENHPEIKKIKWEPAEWKEVLDRIKQMRMDKSAPVDTMGCDALSSLDENLSSQARRFQILISLMLSSQTKDEVTAKAMNQLQKLPLDIDTILSTNEERISELIYPVSFYKRKAVYIKRTAALLRDLYNNDIPNSIEELCKLPGVGPKMAYIAMSVAWNNNVGIGVDTHVHRISNRLGWTKNPTKTPEHTRKALEEWLPRAHWDEVNHLLVGFGQQTCRPVGPKCNLCLCKDLCPTGLKTVTKLKNKSKSKIK